MLFRSVLLSRTSVKNGRIYLPDGMSYSLLNLSDHKDISVSVMKKIEQMVRQGIILVGNPPVRSSGLSGYPDSDDEIKAINQLTENDIQAIIDLDHYVVKVVKYYTIDNYAELSVLGYSDESIDQINLLTQPMIDILIKQSSTVDYKTWMDTEYFLLPRF